MDQFQNATIISSSSTYNIEAIEKFEYSLNSFSKNNTDYDVQYLDLKKIHENKSDDYSFSQLKQVYGNTTLLYHVILNNEYSKDFQPQDIKLIISDEESNYLLVSGTIDVIDELLMDDRIYKVVLPHITGKTLSEELIYDKIAIHNFRYQKQIGLQLSSLTSSEGNELLSDQFSSIIPSIKINPSVQEIFNSEILYSTLYHTEKDSKNHVRMAVYAVPEFANNFPSWLNVTSVYNYEYTNNPHIIVHGWLSISDVNQLEKLESVLGIEPISKPIFSNHNSSHTVGSGISLTHADDLHSSGITGKNKLVAVIDFGFNVTDPALYNIADTGFFGCPDLICAGPSTDFHGNAVAEIILDMAPDSNLLLYAVDNREDFVEAVEEARNDNADIIIDSIGFREDGGNNTSGKGDYIDGTSKTATAYLQASDQDEILTVSAIGNQGQRHNLRTYVEVPIEDIPDLPLNPFWHGALEFDSTQTGAMKACLPLIAHSNTFNIVMVTWNDWSWDKNGRADDYDIFIYDSTMTNRLVSSGGGLVQATNFPLETTIYQTPLSSETVCLVVVKGGAAPTSKIYDFHIHGLQGFDFPANSILSTRSIITPADSEKTLSVGAINAGTQMYEDFSSQGSTDDNRNKPEICAPSGVSLDSFHHSSFSGTSASAPHVAGAAALLLEQDPTLTVDQLRQILVDKAIFDSNYSQTNLCGSDSGLLSLACSPPQSGDWTINFNCILPESFTAPGNVIVQNNSTLTIPNGISLDIDFANNYLLIREGSGVLIKLGGKID